MRQKKRMLPMYAIYDRTNIQKMLQHQAEHGWMLEKVGNYLWTFRRTEPQKLHFAVTYFPSATFYDPAPSERQRTLEDFCRHAGWTLLGSFGPMQVFCTQRPDPLPIETDPLIELENIHKTVKNTYIDSYWLLLAVWVLNLGMQIANIIRNPLDFLGSNLSLFNFSNAFLLVIMCLVEILGYYSWHRKAKRVAMEYGTFQNTRNYKWVGTVFLSVMLIELVLLLLTMKSKLAGMMGMMLVGLLCVVMLGQGLISIMKRMKVSASVNKGVSTLVVCALTILVIYVPILDMMHSQPEQEENAEIYEYRGNSFTAYHDPLPLYVEDLMDPEYDRYSCRLETAQSLFLTAQKVSQRSRMGESALGIYYDIYDIHVASVFDICFEDILHSYDKFNNFDDAGNVTNDCFNKVDPTPWGADAAYCRYSGGVPTQRFLLRYGYRIVEITFNWEPTEPQMAIVAEKLGK